MLSASQQQIIDNITSEFNKYNDLKLKSNPLSGLIDISEIVKEKSDLDNRKTEIRANNIAFRKKLISELEGYVEELSELLKPLGLSAKLDTENSPSIKIGNKNDDCVFRIYSRYNESSRDFINGYKYLLYGGRHHMETIFFSTMESLISSKDFKNKLKDIYVK
tara:strand:- start:91 stop:579 length:489 start_codon:yes stop_codon:yes gene_type:complete